MEELDLSPEQQEQIKAIKQETREQLRALRQEKNEANREQAKAIVKQSREAVEAVLTPEQQAKLAQLKADKKAAWEAVDKEALKAELKAYREEKIEPVLRASRGKLDAFIAKEDQAEIERLRGVFATRPDKEIRGDKRGNRDDQAAKKSAQREASKAWRTEHAEDLESLRALTEKYQVELQRVQDVLESSRETWRQDMSAIKAKYLPEGMEDRGRKVRKARAAKKGKAERQGKEMRRSRGGKRMKAGAFLLMKS